MTKLAFANFRTKTRLSQKEWEMVFSQSRANGGDSTIDIPPTSWKWPTDTFLQRRLKLIRDAATRNKGE